MRLYAKSLYLTILVFVCQVVFLLPSVLYAQKGTVIMLYGTSCAGKSTLAKELQERLPGNFLIVKKAPLVDEKRKNIVEKTTGRRPKNKEELLEAMFQLPKQQLDEARKQVKIGLEETFVTIKPLVNQGANIIFDVCISNTSILKLFDGYDCITVLVYAPLPVLLQRFRERIKDKQNSELLIQRKKAVLLGCYCKIFKIAEDDGADYIDTLSYHDVTQYYLENESALIYPYFKTSVMRLFNKFELEKKNNVKIVPENKPDIIINTDQQTVGEGCQMVKSHLLKGIIS